ncbi:MAG: GAF domain-containing protein, partial [Pyrinomonadaceae bacterium]|nr:GAF domain-containing protein [Pyrinomonadaceae bacterium]
MNAKLTITDPTGNTWETEFAPGEAITIGRARENVITLNDRRVSRKHAFIIGKEGSFRIVDGHIENGQLIRSVNHVFVNGSQHLEITLNDEDVIVIGESQLVFSSVAPVLDAAESEPVGQGESPTAQSVTFDDSPMGHTQVQLSVNEFMGRRSNLSLEPEAATPEEVKDLRRKAKILELLFEMSKTLGTVFDLEEIFERATDLIFRGTPADRVIALLTSDETKDGKNDPHASLYQIGAKTREASFAKLSEKLAVSRTITRKVMDDRVAVLSQDAKTDELFGGAESIVSQGVRSTICAPLITQSGVHGVLYADRLDPFAAFRQDHLELISAVAAQTAVTVETVKAHQRLAREEVARANYGRFMPEYVVKQLLEDPDSFRLGGVNETITVLFADIRGFTGISERAAPEKVVGLLNQYFSAMSEIIFENSGTLDKYIGDGLMALFGAPKPTPNDAKNALTAAVAMQKKLAELRAGPAGAEFAQLS